MALARYSLFLSEPDQIHIRHPDLYHACYLLMIAVVGRRGHLGLFDCYGVNRKAAHGRLRMAADALEVRHDFDHRNRPAGAVAIAVLDHLNDRRSRQHGCWRTAGEASVNPHSDYRVTTVAWLSAAARLLRSRTHLAYRGIDGDVICSLLLDLVLMRPGTKLRREIEVPSEARDFDYPISSSRSVVVGLLLRLARREVVVGLGAYLLVEAVVGIRHDCHIRCCLLAGMEAEPAAGHVKGHHAHAAIAVEHRRRRRSLTSFDWHARVVSQAIVVVLTQALLRATECQKSDKLS